MFKFEELRVHQEALSFINDIYTVTSTWPKEELFGLINQIRRAAVSISLNIAEGSGRTKKDFRHFIDLARSSCYECVAILTVAQKRNYFDLTHYKQLYETCNKLSRMLSALKISIKN